MNINRDWRKDERILIPSRPAIGHQPQQIPQKKDFLAKNENADQDINTQIDINTDKYSLEGLKHQNLKIDEDHELTTIAAQLRATSSDAIDPSFVEKLGNDLLQKLVAHHTVKTKPIKDMDDIPSVQLPTIAIDIANLPDEERNAFLQRLPRTEKLQPLEQTFQEKGSELHNAAPHPYENDFEHEGLLRRAYKCISGLLKRFYGQSRKNHFGQRHSSGEPDSY